jgi:hypothetical protein
MLGLVLSWACFWIPFLGEGGNSASESVMERSSGGAGGPCRRGDSRGIGAMIGDSPKSFPWSVGKSSDESSCKIGVACGIGRRIAPKTSSLADWRTKGRDGGGARVGGGGGVPALIPFLAPSTGVSANPLDKGIALLLVLLASATFKAESFRSNSSLSSPLLCASKTASLRCFGTPACNLVIILALLSN